MRVYISGAITGTADYPLRFASAEQKLELMGHEVINPVKLNCVLPKLTYGEHMDIDLLLISMCQAVYVLPNSGESKGVKMEIEHAIDNDIPVHYL